MFGFTYVAVELHGNSNIKKNVKEKNKTKPASSDFEGLRYLNISILVNIVDFKKKY